MSDLHTSTPFIVTDGGHVPLNKRLGEVSFVFWGTRNSLRLLIFVYRGNVDIRMNEV